MHPCARCALTQRTCCQQAEVVVTTGDVGRIAVHAGRDDFWERRPAGPEYAAEHRGDPEWLTGTLAADGTRRVLRRRPDGSCGFLGEAGCSLPEDVRPLVCRLYPFDYTAAGLAPAPSAHYCPTALLQPPGQTMVDVLGMSAEDAERWRRMLYAELRQERHGDASRTHLRSAG